jgi:hypothetical protein
MNEDNLKTIKNRAYTSAATDGISRPRAASGRAVATFIINIKVKLLRSRVYKVLDTEPREVVGH